MKKYTKLFQTKALSVDPENKTIDFIISDNEIDRYGDRVHQQSWYLKNYDLNPIVLWLHRGHNAEPEDVLGTSLSVQPNPDGSHTVARIKFDTDINPKADLVFQQCARGTLRTVSVGFIPHTIEYEDDVPVLKDNELLEISIVPIPANPRAVALAYKDGSITQKDAQWLAASMRKEADLIEAETKPKQENKSMTEEQAKMLSDVAEAVKALDTKVDSVVEKQEVLATDLTAVKEAQVKAAEPVEEDEDDPAKGGDTDQPGAGEDEFEDDTELTPEQEAEMEADLQAQLAKLDADD